MNKIFFTSSAANYFPKVKLLFDSLRKYQPDCTLVWLVAEKKREDAQKLAELNRYEILFADDLEVGKQSAWLFGMNIVELATALKPFAAQVLLEKYNSTGVIYLDPDIVTFRNLDELSQGFETYDVILTPHLNKPETDPKLVLDNELCALKHGVFNLGFFGVKNSFEGLRFLSWWQERVYKFCFTDLASGVFTDQKWINFAPIFFENVWINRDPTLNVAPWNLGQRHFSGGMKEGYQVDGKPLGFYHFTGFDSGAHLIAAAPYLTTNPSLKSLVTWYQEKSSNSGSTKIDPRWGLGFYSSGEKINDDERKIFRETAELQKNYSNPYEARPHILALKESVV